MQLNMRDIARSGHVTRWHSVRTGRAQTLAEHHYMVTMIADALAQRVFGEALQAQQRLDLLEYALTHDTPELLMGDIPTPLKRRIRQLCGAHDPLERIEMDIAPELMALKQRLAATPLAVIAKLADLMDALLFIREEGIGRHAAMVAGNILEDFHSRVQLAREEYPDLSWEAAETLLGEMYAGLDNQIAFEATS